MKMTGTGLAMRQAAQFFAHFKSRQPGMLISKKDQVEGIVFQQLQRDEGSLTHFGSKLARRSVVNMT